MALKNILIYLGLIIYLYLTATIATYIGIESIGTTSSLIIVLMALHSIASNGINTTVKKFKIEIIIIAIGLSIIVIKIIANDFAGIQQVIFFILVPILVSILLQSQSAISRKKLANILIIFYIIECLLAIYERFFLINVFPYEEVSAYSDIEFLGFRSTSLLGHPLQNALCVSTIMGFILTSNIQFVKKILFFVLGYTALLCFNARGAILIWSVVFPLYVLILLSTSGRKDFLNIPVLFIFSLTSFAILYLIFNQNFGDRLFSNELIDGSALTRIEVYTAFLFIDESDFLFGNSQSYFHVMNSLGAGGVENSFIVVILNYGIIMGLLIIVIYGAWLKKIFSKFNKIQTVFIFISFILVGSLNNSLASQLSWSVFIICFCTIPYISSDNIKNNSYTKKLN